MRVACGYPTFAMSTVLGLFGMLVFIAGVIALASVVTWTVVKISPAKKAKPKPAETES